MKLGKIKSEPNSNKNKNKKILRVITAKALKQEIDYFHKNNFGYFITRNLPIKADKNTTLALIFKNKFDEEKIIFHVFNNSILEKENDIPFFHKEAPEGYSLFCCQNEFNQLMNYLKKNKKEKKIKNPKQEIFEIEPIPHKKHFVCQICKMRFENYLEHIHSKIHEQNKMNFADDFNRMKNTFKRIILFNKNKNVEKEKIKVISSKKKNNEIIIKKENKIRNSNGNENISTNIISDNYNNETMNSDSLLKENNKIYKNKSKRKKNIKNGLNYVETSNIKETKDNKDINLKDIKHILDTIKCRPVINSYYNKKRKKNEICKNFFNENYIYDFQRITGKISHFNDLYNKK